MSFPELPPAADGEVLLVSSCYAGEEAQWGGVLGEVAGCRHGDVLVLGSGEVRLRLVANTGWGLLYGGNLPALVPAEGAASPVVVLVDDRMVYGGGGPLLVDLALIPGRAVRVRSDSLREVLAAMLDGALTFDDLVRDMDTSGVYQGGDGRPAFPAPVWKPHRNFPGLASTAEALLVRTSFEDEDGWQALLAEFGGIDEDGWVGADLAPSDFDVEDYPLAALVVDDRTFEGLHPGQVPALVPPGNPPTLVALADTRTFTDSGRPLTVVDLYDTPGQLAVLPWHRVGSMACNLQIANMDFHDYVAREGTRPWWA
ncbi:DUF6924 domain-containing protein [Actinomadura sp. WAC 06369]|uniref:DUF6924 domain-containing protein n=1 Tax=Actinomadura sp. WAC 06369 TaxID=2203193 RepID=UPI000F77C5E0|nr:hypothetical protein [Actinomadura sp. WAC 06369]RSN52208.1 hypothetical protein DMH08_28975 [Actinomadura sp. WAC 06369]